MKAVGFFNPLPLTDDQALVDLDLPAPTPGPHDLLVRVKAVSVNPVDTKVRKSAQPEAGQARVLGFDAAGVVEAVGEAVRGFQVGDRVFYAGSIARPGTNAELHAVDARIVGHAPSSLGDADAAALPLTSITAWELLFDRLKVPRGGGEGETLLVIGGAGGVGSILVQLARQLTKQRVIATASRPETRQWCLTLGAHDVIDHSQPLAPQVKALGIEGVDRVISLTQSDQHMDQIVEALKPQGQFALIDDPKVFDGNKFKRKSISIHWELMFTRPVFGTPDMHKQGELLEEVARLVDAGTLRTTANASFGTINAANLRKAHALIESGTAQGKLVLAGF